MCANDNGGRNETERRLRSFIEGIRLKEAEEWLWKAKLAVTICTVSVWAMAVIGGWYNLPGLVAILASGLSVGLIISMEMLLAGEWHGRFAIEQRRPVVHWEFVRKTA